MVTIPWDDVAVLRSAVDNAPGERILEAVFVDHLADWRLVTVYAGLTSAKPIYNSVHNALLATEAQLGLLSHLVVLDVQHPDASPLLRAPISEGEGPSIAVSSLPEFEGIVIARDEKRANRYMGSLLERDVERTLLEDGRKMETDRRLDVGWEPDLQVETASGYVLVDVKTVHGNNVRNRIWEAAGLANISGNPVVLVLDVRGGTTVRMEERVGVIPVFLVEWSAAGHVARLNAAVAGAEGWLVTRQDQDAGRSADYQS